MIRPYETHEMQIIALQDEKPNEEVCGVLLRREYGFEVKQLANLATAKDKVFSMDMGAVLKEDVSMLWHTHSQLADTDGLSDPDKWTSAEWGLPMCVYVKRTRKFHYWQPGDYHASIVGRPWCPEIFDCFALIRDALLEYLDVKIPDLDRTFLHAAVGLKDCDLYWKSIGAELVFKPEIGRVAVINYHGSRYPNHCGLLVQDKSMLHQLRGAPSRVDPYGDMWRKATLYFVRHADIEHAIETKQWRYDGSPNPVAAPTTPVKPAGSVLRPDPHKRWQEAFKTARTGNPALLRGNIKK